MVVKSSKPPLFFVAAGRENQIPGRTTSAAGGEFKENA